MPGFLDIMKDPRIALAAGLLTPQRNSAFGPALGQGLSNMNAQVGFNQQDVAAKQALANAEAKAQARKQFSFDDPQGSIAALIQGGDAQGANAASNFISTVTKEGANPTVAGIVFKAAGGDPKLAMKYLAELNKASAANNTVNLNMQKPLGGDAANWTNSEGKNPPATYGIAQAVAEGYSPKTKKQIDSTFDAKAATPIVSDIITFGFGNEGEESLFPPASKGTASRLVDAGADYLKGLTKSDERISLYNDSKRGFRAGIARLLGHTGVLTAKDVGDATALIPVPGLTKDPQARRQFQQMASLLMGKGVSREDLEAIGFPEWAFGGAASDDIYTPEERALLNKHLKRGE